MTEDRAVPSASPMAVLVAEAHEHSAQRPTFFQSLVRFCITGLGSVGTDFGLLALLHSVAHAPLLVSTLVAWAGSLSVNYTLNRNWSFQAKAGHGYTALRYAVLVGVNLGSTLLIVLGLTHLGLYYLVSKLVAVAANAGSNFLAARYWVFKD